MRRAAMVFGVTGGAVAWILHLGVSYAAVPFVCSGGGEGWLHAITLATAGVAGAAVVTSWRLLERPAGDGAPGGQFRHFFPFTGLLLGAFFLLLIVAEGLPALLVGDPCGDIPTLDRPIIQAPLVDPPYSDPS